MAASESSKVAQQDNFSDMHFLVREVQNGGKKAESELLCKNKGLIWSIVRRFIPRAAPRGIEPEDLYQLGSIGFIKAVRNFDFSKGTTLSTYAVPKIIGEIKRFLRDDGLIKISRSTKEAANKLNAARERFVYVKGVEPTIEELSEITGISAEDIITADMAIIALDSVISKKPAENGRGIENIAGSCEMECGIIDKVELSEAISKLDKREKAVISLRYRRSLTQQKTAEILGISQVQVSRIENKTLSRLREFMLDRH